METLVSHLVSYGPFLLAALVLNIAPGPDLTFVAAQAATHGRKIGIMSSLGVCSGAFVHVVFAALGLSAILMTSSLAFAVVKWVGVLYLAWLGIGAIYATFKHPVAVQALVRDDNALAQNVPVSSSSRRRRPAPTAFRAWRQGALIDVFNPKVALFFMAFLPQFVNPALGHQPAQFFILGTIVNMIGFMVETAVVLVVAAAAGQIGRYFSGKAALGKWVQRALGAVFLALGVRLALSDRGM
ncbi:LysE family translocator [uncultured Thalassospira sp.]|uniref:LysE family translocator n=1 Tax=uncultured Thalassospira sp. TaxID=404382 RepID=UPI0030D99C53|tara:strand:+ start:349 stop:1071 length:723 start_codon:yes stop_codon:yes gene_type:complete